MQQFYRPNGDSTQKRGVLADVDLPWLTNEMDVGEADLDYAVEFDRIPAAPFRKNDFVNPKLLTELKARSVARRNESEDFQKLDKNIRRYREQKDKKVVTLNEEKFLAERAELDAEREEEKHFKEQFENADRPVFDRNFYTEEVLAVAIDYLELMQKSRFAKLD
jgi:carboxyl-terminal processing protease